MMMIQSTFSFNSCLYGTFYVLSNLHMFICELNNCWVMFQGSESPEKHALYVWRNFIQNAKAQSIAIVAHSYGGVVILELVSYLLRHITWIAANTISEVEKKGFDTLCSVCSLTMSQVQSGSMILLPVHWSRLMFSLHHWSGVKFSLHHWSRLKFSLHHWSRLKFNLHHWFGLKFSLHHWSGLKFTLHHWSGLKFSLHHWSRSKFSLHHWSGFKFSLQHCRDRDSTISGVFWCMPQKWNNFNIPWLFHDGHAIRI